MTRTTTTSRDLGPTSLVDGGKPVPVETRPRSLRLRGALCGACPRFLSLGIALGLTAGGAALEAGVLVLLLLVPAVVWASREKSRPLGLGGLVIGLGAGIGGPARARRRAVRRL
ncbi:MAG TPA: hypothetical protein VF763_01635 [Candidatus Limnocylindrales bacterium]